MLHTLSKSNVHLHKHYPENFHKLSTQLNNAEFYGRKDTIFCLLILRIILYNVMHLVRRFRKLMSLIWILLDSNFEQFTVEL